MKTATSQNKLRNILLIIAAALLLIGWIVVYVLSCTAVPIPVDRIYGGYRLIYNEPYSADSQPTASVPVTVQFSGTLYRDEEISSWFE